MSLTGENSFQNGSTATLGSKGTKIVRLNVGGTKFVTTEATLLSCGSSFFSSLLSGFPSLKDEDGAYFIDRDGACFAPILSFLRTGQLIVPPHVPRDAVLREADFFSIDIPKQETDQIPSLAAGLFVSDKYKENEVVLFNENNTGFVIRGGSSKVEFTFEVLPGSAIEIVWKTDSSRSLVKLFRDKDKADEVSPRRNIWFLSGSSLITSAINVYTFLPQQPAIEPGSIYTNVRTPLTIYETGQIYGFRFPSREELAAVRDRNQSIDSDPGSPPQSSSTAQGSSNANFLYCDIRNQWAKCRFLRSKFCNNLDSFHIKYKAVEPIRHKSYLSYSNHEYESCYETFTIELLVFQEVLLARLVSYNLVRKDRSIIPVQFTTNFVAYKHGIQQERVPE
eukprot:TRINITY_DN1742_c0_g1_i3.p1 TRINITY_DN1742_c0_g1~~TRINITY_DN1742_c0_g1_i3.p1  ORF type:complete len:393 (+),score=40.08 TRINITY_DN1742_c0_g1_i3:112-1290(+)